MKHKIQCQCGKLTGEIQGKGVSCRGVCYCADCQTFAKFLGRPGEVLDAHGGTEVVQVAQPRVAFLQGQAHLAAVRLSPKGIVRWYAACCKTPIGNTLINPKVSFFGLIHTVLDRAKLDADFGKSIARVNVHSATGSPKPKQKGLSGTVLRFLWIIGVTRITGKYRQSPLFNASGDLIVKPTILTREEREHLKAAPWPPNP